MSSEQRLSLTGIVEPALTTDYEIVVEVERTAPAGADSPATETAVYVLRPRNALNLLGVFRELYFHHDPTFGFRNFECGRGICSTCNVMYEGRVQKGCRIAVPSGSHIRLATQGPNRTLRDLVCRIGDEPDSEED